AVGRHHDRIEHHLLYAVVADRPGDDVHDLGRMQHADLERIHADVAEHRLDLRLEKVHRYRMNAGDASGVLRGQCGNRRHGITAKCGNGLDVGLDAGTATAVGTGDREYAWIVHGEN